MSGGLVEELTDPGGSFEAAMTLAAKIAAQPPLSVAMTKSTVNRLAHALDHLASHMDIDQFALASFSEDHEQGGRRRVPGASQAALPGALAKRNARFFAIGIAYDHVDVWAGSGLALRHAASAAEQHQPFAD
jgi:hypothetical protein